MMLSTEIRAAAWEAKLAEVVEAMASRGAGLEYLQQVVEHHFYLVLQDHYATMTAD